MRAARRGWRLVANLSGILYSLIVETGEGIDEMRTREEIVGHMHDGLGKHWAIGHYQEAAEKAILEVLLDIRELTIKNNELLQRFERNEK
jgi:hypothetical protein